MVDSVPYFIARISEDKDFFQLREMAENHDGWALDYDKTSVKVWTKHVDDSSFNMVKVWAIFSNVNCVDLYDAIQDPEYRKEWDSHMILGVDIGYLNPNNDVSYYAMYCPTPLKNRDLVLQKSWLDAGTEFYIINHSVCHKDYPPKKGFVRATSYFTGYFIRCQALNRESNGCELSYVTRSDPQGDLPSWLVNKCTQILAPRYVKQIERAASKYGDWKNNNNPLEKPWVYPEQIKTPRLSVRDCVPCREELEMNPFLRNFNFDLFLTPEKNEAPTCTANVGNEGSVQGRGKDFVCNKDIVETQLTCQGIPTQNECRRGESKKTKNKLNSLLKFAKICGKKAGKEN